MFAAVLSVAGLMRPQELSLEQVGCAYVRDYYAAQGGTVSACRLSNRKSLGSGLAEATFDVQLGNQRFPAKLRFVKGTWQVTFAMPSS